MSTAPPRGPFDANLIVIGAGSAGLVSAYIAAAVKAKVILVEKGAMGGDCLNTGCVPSKALIRAARFLHGLKEAERLGITKATAEFDFATIMERVQRVVGEVAPHDSVERYQRLGVEVIRGEARLLSPRSVEVDGRLLTARSIIVATGARPFVPPIKGIDEVGILTSDNLWSLRELPPRLLVLGGGPIGCELAQCFARFGSEVTIVEMLPRILAREDEEISDLVAEQFRREGINLRTGHEALRFLERGGEQRLLCRTGSGSIEIPFDRVLVAVGRAADVEGFGLEELGVPVSRRGTIEVDRFLRAGIPGLYACGDVAGPFQFTHAASHQAWHATVNALFGGFRKFRVDYSVMPRVTFTDPEVAAVGLNEQEAGERGIDFEITRYDLSDLDRAIADGAARGAVKVLTRPGKDRILGAAIAGEHAGEMITEFSLAMRHGLGLNGLLRTIHPYPTWMEANRFAAGAWKRAHTPTAVLSLLERWFRWRRR